jgi:DNA-binding LytR/AlgR family response regulator
MPIIQKEKIDLIFSDIQMPSLSGFQLVQSLPKKPMVIFITAYADFAVESYEIDVVDYLVKPVAFNRFLLSANKAMAMYKLNQPIAVLEKTFPNVEHVFLQVDYGLVRIYFDEIIMIEALKDYVKIHFKPLKKAIVARMSMKLVEDIFPNKRFIRIHKSFIVAETAITIIKKTSIFLGDIELPIGDTYRDKLEGIIGKKL